jgi:hypothetical protein
MHSLSERKVIQSIPKELKISLEDLDTSLLLNKQILKEVLELKKKEQEDTDNGLISFKVLAGINLENERIADSIRRMQIETNEAQDSLQINEQKIAESRKRKKEFSARFKREIMQLREQLLIKEDETRNVEKYSATINEVYKNYLNEELNQPEKIMKETLKILNNVKKELKFQKILQKNLVKKCKDLEKKAEKFCKKIKVEKPKFLAGTEKILNKNYDPLISEIIGKNLENSLGFDEEDEENAEVSSVLNSKSPLDLHIHSITTKSIENQEFIEVFTLELANRLLSEEIINSNRILNELECQEHTLGYNFLTKSE